MPSRLSRLAPLGREWGVVLALWALLLFVIGYEIVPASLLPVIMDRLAVGPTTASWIVSGVFLSMAVASIPAGMALDRVDNRRAIGAFTVALLVASLWGWQAGAAGAYWSLLASRFLGGVTVVSIWIASVNVVGDVADADRQATAIGFLATGIPAGTAVGLFAGPLIAARFGWTAAFPLFGVLAAVALVPFLAVSRPVADGVTDDTAAPSWGEFRDVLTSGPVWAIALLAFIAYSAFLTVTNWMPTYVVDRFSLSLAEGGLFTALFPTIGIVSRASGGVISDRLFDRRRKPIVVGSMLVTALVMFAIVPAGTLAVVFACMIVAGFSIQLALVILFPYVRELVAPNVAGTALAVLNAVGFFGAFAAPVLTGALIERVDSFLPVFVYAGAIAAVGVVIAWLAPESKHVKA